MEIRQLKSLTISSDYKIQRYSEYINAAKMKAAQAVNALIYMIYYEVIKCEISIWEI